jgi:hypothetical protein
MLIIRCYFYLNLQLISPYRIAKIQTSLIIIIFFFKFIQFQFRKYSFG